MTSVPDIAVTVVIPAYNGGPLLVEQLRTLAQQDFDERWEVVLADNGTTDGSLDDLTEFAASLEIRVIDASARRGPSYARNEGARQARGEWLAFCDTDDLMARGWLSALYAMRNDFDIVAGKYDVLTLNPPADVDARGGAEHWSGLLRGPAGFLPFAGSANLLIRRSFYLDIGGFDESIPGPGAEDVDLSWRVQLGGGTLGYAPDAVMHYRFRTSPRAVYRQARAYKLAETELYARYYSVGMQSDPPGYLRQRCLWLASRAPYLVLGRRRQVLWCTVAGEVVGMYRTRGARRVIDGQRTVSGADGRP